MATHRFGTFSSVAKYFLACVILSIAALFYVSLTLEKHFVFYPAASNTRPDENVFFINQSSSTYHCEATDFYPHLPIQIYTKNRQRFLQLQNVSKKVILLGNTLFDDPMWTMKSIQNNTNAGNSMSHHSSGIPSPITSDLIRSKTELLELYLVQLINS
jgi:hypothetical protein